MSALLACYEVVDGTPDAEVQADAVQGDQADTGLQTVQVSLCGHLK